MQQGQSHDKLCYCAFRGDIDGIFWLIPISSKIEKYHSIYDKKIAKYHKCDTLVFGKVFKLMEQLKKKSSP